MKIAGYERAAGGFAVTIEHENAYTNGSSRFEKVHVSDAAVRGKSRDQVRQAIKDAADADPIADIIGEDVAAPTPTKPILEERMVAQYERWQRWKNTRLEAQARGLAGAVVTAVTNVENDAWGDYVAAVQAWRQA